MPFIEAYRSNLVPKNDRRKEIRQNVKEKARLIINGEEIACRVLSHSASILVINTIIPDYVTYAHVHVPSMGEFPVRVAKRYNDRTVFQFKGVPLREANAPVRYDVMGQARQLKAV